MKLDDFLENLNLQVTLHPAKEPDVALISQLTQHTAEFHLTAVAHSPETVRQFCQSPLINCQLIEVQDRFGDYGIAGVIITRLQDDALMLDTFLLNCRVLGKRVEHTVLQQIAQEALAKGQQTIQVRYRKTPRNYPALTFLQEIANSQLKAEPEGFVATLPLTRLASLVAAGPTLSTPPATAPKPITSKPSLPTIRRRKPRHTTSNLQSGQEILNAIHKQQQRLRPATAHQFVDARTATEKALVTIWQNMLHLQKVGVFDNFFALGGHSLLAAQVVSRIHAHFQLLLPVRALFEHPTIAELARHVDALRQAGERSDLPVLTAVSRSSRLPLSFAQQRLWFLDQLMPGNPFYNIPAAIRLTGELDVVTLEKSLNTIVQRHEVLRTVFAELDGQVVQIINPPPPVAVQVVDLTHLSAESKERELLHLAQQEAQRPFDLTQVPLLRATLLHLAPLSNALLITMHHIVSDAWSNSLLVEELVTLYEAYLHHKPDPLPPLPLQYADFAVWQHQWLKGEVLEQALAYWRSQLADLPTVSLPTDRPRPTFNNFRGAAEPITISRSATQALHAIGRQNNASLFMTLLAAFQTLLYRYTHMPDITVGTPIAGRNQQETEKIIGFFVNMLALRTGLSGNPTFNELLGRVRETALDAYTFQELPFEKLVEALQPERDMSRTPLFQITFVLQNIPIPPLALPNLTIAPLSVDYEATRFDLSLHLWETEGELRGNFIYSTELFDGTTIQQLARHFASLLSGIVENPDQSIGSLPLLLPVERQHLLTKWNDTKQAFPLQCVYQLIASQATRTPDAIAASQEAQSLSYEALESKANQLARYLQDLGVGTDTLVGVYLERSLEMVVAILAIWKAGGAYVPLDPNDPPQRLAFMLQDTQLSILLTQSYLLDSLAAFNQQVTAVSLDKIAQFATYDTSPPASPVSLDNLAYVIYTSGSTGQPKGVMVSHRALCNRLLWGQQTYPLGSLDRVLQAAAFNFDFSVWELWAPLLAGATVVMLPANEHKAISTITETIAGARCTVAHFVPTVLSVFLNQVHVAQKCASLRLIFSGGEALSTALRRQCAVQLPQTALYNQYGPTETCIDASFWHSSGDEPTATVPIGHPIANTDLYVLDAHLALVPTGVIGELYIGGMGVGRGYLKRPGQTAVSFIPHPFSHQPGSRLYKTGDLVRRLSDGALEFVRRRDHQVKIRGFRIELGETESVLNQHPAVQQSVVAVRKDAQGARRLVAYVLPNTGYQLSPEQEAHLVREQVTQWQMVFQEVHHQPATTQPDFDTTGWHSSYTNQPLPASAMQEWVEGTVQRLQSLHPQRVLEIGCGTGLLLLRLAPQCQHYVGTDFSPAILDQLREKLALRTEPLPQVQLWQQTADDFSQIPANSFDLVILNSVVQYFPNEAYLEQVLSQAITAVRPQGKIFIGDVRNLALLPTFHTSVQLHKAPASLPISQLQQRIQKQIGEEEELLIHPHFFTRLKQTIPAISHVQVQLRRGHDVNELTRFRYDVVLHVGQPDTAVLPEKRHWQADALDLPRLRHLLEQESSPVLAVSQIPNKRLVSLVTAVQQLKQVSPSTSTGQLRQTLHHTAPAESVDPEVLWALGQELGYHTYITWSSQLDHMDAVFQQVDMQETNIDVLPALESLLANRPTTVTNNPLHGAFIRKLTPRLRRYLQERLPDYMIPATFIPLNAFPQTASGKIDRQALPAPERARPELDAAFVAPQSATEASLAQIWRELLQLDQIGIHDDFFILGGHSLLATQAISRIRRTFQIDLPLRLMFEHPTIAGLATAMKPFMAQEDSQSIPAIKRVSREKYRRTISDL